MKIEFKKVPQTEKEFNLNFDSVEFSGTFCRISQNLIKLSGTIKGNFFVDCYKCGVEHPIYIDEKHSFILSDGIFLSENEREDELIMEVENHIVDFDEILMSELESIKSDYHICDSCRKDNKIINLEY